MYFKFLLLPETTSDAVESPGIALPSNKVKGLIRLIIPSESGTPVALPKAPAASLSP